MAKRKNLRNPDILPFDYVSILLNWRTNSPLTATPTFTVAKVLGGTFPFNANMLSFTAVDSSSSISFVFQSPFDINTSPWQFELELAFTATVSKFRPTAVYNGSNNQITVKFNISPLVATTSYPVVFTAKRYRPTTQYLAQLAAASQNPVTVSSTGQIQVTTPLANSFQTEAIGSSSTYGYYFTAPSNFTISNLGHAVLADFTNLGFIWDVEVVLLNAALPTTNITTLYYGAAFTPVNNISVSIPIFTNNVIAIFSNYSTGINWRNAFRLNVGSQVTTINGTSVTLNGIARTPFQLGPPNPATNFAAALTNIGATRFSTGGGATWSNIIY